MVRMERDNKLSTIYLTIKSDLERVEDVLNKTVASSEIPIVREIASHVIFSGGKRIRPAISILSAQICGEAHEKTSFLAAAIELIHTASIMHDDVLDGSELRRGRVTTNAKWGNHLSILIGDFCFSSASRILSKHTSTEIIERISNAVTETTEGEILEVLYTNKTTIDIPTYMKVIELKTARLISAAGETASLLVNAPTRLVQALKEYGTNLGLAFQIMDDVLDYKNSTEELGKRSGVDLREGKLTLPLLYALKNCEGKECEIIKESLLTNIFSTELFNSVKTILERHDCLKDALNTASNYVNRAKAALTPFRTSFEKEALISLADYAIERKN